MNEIKIQRLHEDAIIPAYQSEQAAAFDVHAIEGGSVEPGEIAKIPLGFAVEFPPGWAMLMTARSGHGSKFGAGVPHGYGLVDPDYRGQVFMVLTTTKPLAWKKGERIGQAMLVQAPRFRIIEVDALSETERGTGGFGSTGTA